MCVGEAGRVWVADTRKARVVEYPAVSSLGTFWIVQTLLLVVVIAGLTRWASQLYYYRSGV